MTRSWVSAMALLCSAEAAFLNKRQTTVPQYFQTSPELYPGPTATGDAPLLAVTNPASFPSVSYIAPQPIETQVPILGRPLDGNIFHSMGQLTHYFPQPSGWGVDEYPLPAGCNISTFFMLHRHGARYPTHTLEVIDKLSNNTDAWKASGKLSFLNEWRNKLGLEILVPLGKQEEFDSGVAHWYQYSNLYKKGTKIIARSTTQDRMTQSAEYFLAGFFGLNWVQNATLELIVEQEGKNNTLAGYLNCPNADKPASRLGKEAASDWAGIYLEDALARINGMMEPKDFFEIADIYDLQQLCSYETVALGYSAFCDLFTWDEWEGFEYAADLAFAGDDSFQSPTGRAVGIGWVEELRARLQQHYLSEPTGQINTTLDSMPETFPLNQTLYFDFSHDTNIMSVLTALGLRMFAQFLPADEMVPRNLIVSHVTPFAARLDIEIIEAPKPVVANRGPAGYTSPLETNEHRQIPNLPNSNFDSSWGTWPGFSSPNIYEEGEPTKYVHMLLNQRTIPLDANYDECVARSDGWCELGAFLKATDDALEKSNFEYACFGEYEKVEYGKVTDGAPIN